MDKDEKFAELLMKSQERLYAFVYSWLRNAADTQDVLQLTATVLWNKFDTFDLDTDFTKWALKVAKFQTLNFLKCRRTYLARFSNEFMDRFAAEELLVEGEFEESRREALAKCVDKLREGDRKLIRSRYGSGMQINQIADLLGRSSSSICNSLNRIRMTLLSCIEKSVLD